MSISIFDLFSIGIGPSSSHTVGPMKAACRFAETYSMINCYPKQPASQFELFGSLAFTGKGHGTDLAILLGLEGNLPDSVNPAMIKPRSTDIINHASLRLNGEHAIAFHYVNDLIYNFKDLLPAHTNGMRYTAYDVSGTILRSEIFYSIGGGFIITEEESQHPQDLAAKKCHIHLKTQRPYSNIAKRTVSPLLNNANQ